MNQKPENDLDRVLVQLEEESKRDDGAQPVPQFDSESPTFASADPKLRGKDKAICATCPHSMWFASATHLQCYCQVMHVITWTSEKPIPILACDGILLSRD